jgi:hypothetical protein
MAYVSINPAFIGRIEAKIDSMCRAELKTLGDAPLINMNAKSAFFLDLVWGEHKHLEPLLPDGFKKEHGEFRLFFVVGDAEFENRILVRNLGAVFPPKSSWYDEYKITTHEALEKYPELEPSVRYYESKAEIEQRWNGVKNKVVSFINVCKSLNEAVKLWPDVVTYIDQDDLERLATKREKPQASTRAAEALAALDTDELMGAAVIARLSGAEL